MKNKYLLPVCAGLLLAQGAARPADVTSAMQSQCAQCHALKAPAPAELTVDRIWQRKGPDLYYAGAKYNQPWLVNWLQAPKPIRPAGEFYFKHVKLGAKEDVVDASTLTPHMKLSKDEATAYAAALMELKGAPGLVEKGSYKQQPGSAAMAAMFFNKLRGCSACHQNAPGTGGLSGPELYTGGERLQADYIHDYIKDPQKFDPHIWMPKLGLNEADLQRLTGYIVGLSATKK
jgi:mono/diheme cytochrome c family protein